MSCQKNHPFHEFPLSIFRVYTRGSIPVIACACLAIKIRCCIQDLFSASCTIAGRGRVGALPIRNSNFVRDCFRTFLYNHEKVFISLACCDCDSVDMMIFGGMNIFAVILFFVLKGK